MENIKNFRKEYMCEWKPNNTPLNPIGLCLLHIYKSVYKNCQWIHGQMGENPNDNLDFLTHVIRKICFEFKINSEKIFDISPSGRVKPNKFESYIDKDTIPKIYKDEYKIVWDAYSNLSTQLRKEQEEREKERYKEILYFYKP